MAPAETLLPLQPATTSASGTSSGGIPVTLNADVITEILAATEAMPS